MGHTLSSETRPVPFSLTSDRYDTKTFMGRLQKNLDNVDPSTLFVSKEKLEGFKQLLDDVKHNRPVTASDEELWEAKKTVNAIIHPDTGKEIFMPFRMSGYVPFGTPIVVGLLLPNPSTAQLVFWQWLNQTHNAAVNFSNANASKPVDTAVLLQGYFGACSGAVAMSVGMTKFLQRLEGRVPGGMLKGLQLVIPYTAVAFANILNVFLMRRGEIESGIDVRDEKGNILGSSKAAAFKAVKETAISRVILPAPILILPPVIMAGLSRFDFVKRSSKVQLAMNAVLCTLSFGLALPVAISIFPQDSSMPSSEAEPEFRDKAKTLFFNKGL